MENNKAGHLEGGAKPEFSEPTTREGKVTKVTVPHAREKSEFFESLHRAREETKTRLFRLDLYARGKSAVLAVHQRAGEIRFFRRGQTRAWDSHQDGRMNGSPGVSKTPGGSLIPPEVKKRPRASAHVGA